MEDIKTLFGVIFVLGFIFLLGWGSAKLCDAYYDYRAKRNRTNHPELIELQKEREKVCKEYNQLWDEKYKAEKQIDFIYERMKYYNNNEKLIAKLQKARETYSNALDKLEYLDPLVEAARRAEDEYKEKHNIRHW